MYQFNAGQLDAKPASNHTTTEKRQITRNRTSYSCITCRRRKVKCDKTRPICGGCQKAKETCVYNDDIPPTSSQPLASKDDSGPIWKKRKSSLTGSDAVGVHAANNVSRELTPPHDLKAIEDQLQRLSKMVDALRTANANGNSPELRLKELLTPDPSSSDSGSDGPQKRPSMSLDMFQANNFGSSKEPVDLSTPLSSLKLNAGEASSEDPFWNHISDEVDQLNYLMRRRDNTYLTSISAENKNCDKPRERPPNGIPEPEPDDILGPNDFHTEAGLRTIETLDPDNSDSLCQLMCFTKSSLLQGVPLKCSSASAMNHIARGLPTRTQSNVLFRCWLSGVYPVVGIFMPSEISKKHEEFWDRMETAGMSGFIHTDLEFLTVLHAIWYAGSLSMSVKGLRQWFPDTIRARLSTQFHDYTVFCLLLGNFSRDVSLYKLGALTVLQSMPIAEEDPLQTNLYLALIVRLAFTMGLHREPTLFDLSIAEESMRRRLWWQIIQLDVFHVVGSGYPSIISEKFCDTRVVCEDRDSYTSDGNASSNVSDGSLKNSSPQSGTSGEDASNSSAFRTLAWLARGKSIMACALRTVLSTHLETKKLTNEDITGMKRTMASAEGHVNSIIKAIPSKGLPEMGFIPEAGRDPQLRTPDSDILMGSPITENDIAYYSISPNTTDPSWPLASYHRQRQAAYNKWARISLSMLIDKVHCVAYAPFLKNTKSRLWVVGRQCALHNCHSFLRKFVSLATDPDLTAFRWGWPALYGPLHAVLIILVDLYERPGSVEAPRSRELVDKVFALSAPESGIVGGPDGVTVQRPLREGGEEAWGMLRGLRCAAWLKAGLDPSFLWTKEDQLEVGVACPLTEAEKIAQSLREDSIYDDSAEKAECSLAGKPLSDLGSTEKGIQYMVKLANEEFGSARNGQHASPLTQAARNHILQATEGEPHIYTPRVLAKREGQQKMPFPLGRDIQACSSKVANSEVPQNPIFDIHNHVPRPAGAPRTCPSQATVIASEADESNGVRPTQGNSQPVSWDQSFGNGNANTQQVPQGQYFGESTNGLIHSNGNANGNGTYNMQTHDAHSMQNSSLAQEDQHGDTAMNLGFDWERWDAVFGQYSGFTELMDDDVSAWSEYGNA